MAFNFFSFWFVFPLIFVFLVDSSQVEPVAESVSLYCELSALYELETCLCIGAAGSDLGDVFLGQILGIELRDKVDNSLKRKHRRLRGKRLAWQEKWKAQEFTLMK